MNRFKDGEIRAENNLVMLFIYLFGNLFIHKQGESTVVAAHFPYCQGFG